eukprot:jgi/Mesvir1/7209/Mv19030-RA.1
MADTAAAEAAALEGHFNGLSLDERFDLVRSVGEECIQENELRTLLLKKKDPVCYDGFEPSGRMHIAQGVMKALNVNRLTKAGCIFKFWVADWFALLNNKMGGDLEKIQTVGKYMIEVWKAVGMDMDRVQFLWSSEEINGKSGTYWPLVMDIARTNKLSRILRCSQIMGRNETDDLSAAQIFYPCMQCADIFFLHADICQLGMDQRKVNMLAREYCDEIKRKLKPIILSHHMLSGLLEGQEKMSKSDPNSAIFMEDSADTVVTKIENAFCPPKQIKGNPCVEYVQYVILPWFGSFDVDRPESEGGAKAYKSVDEIFSDYESGALTPAALKAGLTTALNKILEPVRQHFQNNAEAGDILHQLLEKSDAALGDFPEKRANKRAAEEFVDALDIPASHAQLPAAGPASAFRHLAGVTAGGTSLVRCLRQGPCCPPAARPASPACIGSPPSSRPGKPWATTVTPPATPASKAIEYHSAIRQATKEQEDLHVREYFAHLQDQHGKYAWTRLRHAQRPAGGTQPALRTLSGSPQQQLDQLVVFLPVPAARRPPATSAAWPSGGRLPGSGACGRPCAAHAARR